MPAEETTPAQEAKPEAASAEEANPAEATLAEEAAISSEDEETAAAAETAPRVTEAAADRRWRMALLAAHATGADEAATDSEEDLEVQEVPKEGAQAQAEADPAEVPKEGAQARTAEDDEPEEGSPTAGAGETPPRKAKMHAKMTVTSPPMPARGACWLSWRSRGSRARPDDRDLPSSWRVLALDSTRARSKRTRPAMQQGLHHEADEDGEERNKHGEKEIVKRKAHDILAKQRRRRQVDEEDALGSAFGNADYHFWGLAWDGASQR